MTSLGTTISFGEPVCTLTRLGEDLMVAVTGTVDRTTVPSVRTQLLHAAKEQPAHLVVDLDAAALVDGTGLAALAELWRFTHEHGIDLTLRGPAASVRQLFDLGPHGRVHSLR